jgi:FkbM family methyltransferase
MTTMRIYGVDLITDNDMVVKSLLDYGSFEPESIAAWVDSTKNGVAIDVGAYSGLYAILAAKNGAESIAWECNPVMIARLQQNIAANGVSVEVVESGASDRAGEAKMAVIWSHTSAAKLTTGKGIPVTVNRVTSAKHVSAVKIDVEGHEIQVLNGMAEIIERYKPLIIAEALTEHMERGIADLMARHGYTYRMADGRNMILTHSGAI